MPRVAIASTEVNSSFATSILSEAREGLVAKLIGLEGDALIFEPQSIWIRGGLTLQSKDVEKKKRVVEEKHN